jgi:plastocyanin
MRRLLCQFTPLLIAVGLLLAACAGEAAVSAPTVDGAEEVEIVATDFAFAPDVLMVTAGEPVNVTLRNDARGQHDIALPEIGFRVLARGGGSVSGALTVAEAGTYELVCTIPGHLDQGMRMTLVVEDG